MNEDVTKYIQYYLPEKDRPIEVTTSEVKGRGNGRGNYQYNGYYQYNGCNRNRTKIMVTIETIITRPITIKEDVEIIEETKIPKIPATTAKHIKTIMATLPCFGKLTDPFKDEK